MKKTYFRKLCYHTLMLEIKDREEDRARAEDQAEDRADDRPNAEVILPRQIRVQVTSVITFK